MRYVSLFSGIEAASVAWGTLGWEPMCFCEVDPFPCAVLEQRFPGVPNLGDVREVDWHGFVKAHGRPDVVVGGSPCQSFSVAGKREGLRGASGLMWEFVRAVREVVPRWVVWENVPGALSSSRGEDFRCLLASLDELGYGLAWRVLDAQFFGVAQRRRRVYLVGCLGDPSGAVEVLFEPDGMSWGFGSSREKRAELAAAARGGAQGAGFALKYSAGASAGSAAVCSDGSSPTLTADWHAVCQYGDVAGILTARSDGSPCTDRGPSIVCIADDTANAAVDEELCGTLKCGGSPPSVAFAANQRGEVRLQGGDGSVAGAVTASRSGKQVSGVSDGCTVRRLTPLECERLQGFHDDWTRIAYRGRTAEECPDGPRYKAIGNSMAVPVMAWIGRRIAAVEERIGDDRRERAMDTAEPPEPDPIREAVDEGWKSNPCMY